MARVTVEDCVEKIPNRFDLVMLAAQRSRDIAAGSSITVNRDNDKNPVVALREIADDTVVTDELKNSLIRGMQKLVDTDDLVEDDQSEAMADGLLNDLGVSMSVRDRDEDDDEGDSMPGADALPDGMMFEDESSVDD